MHALEAGALVPAKGRQSCHLDQIGDARPVFLLDQPVELDERAAELLGELPAERRLAGAAQADQRESASAVGRGSVRGTALDLLRDRGKLGRRKTPEHIENVSHRRGVPVRARQQLGDRNVEGLRDGLQDDHRRVALPALDLREIALGRAGFLGQLPTGHAALGARNAHQPPDRCGERMIIPSFRG